MQRLLFLLLAATLATGLFVFALPYPWLTTVAALLAHAGLALGFIALLLWVRPRRGRPGWAMLALSGVPAVAVLSLDTGGAAATLMALHGVLAIAGALWLIATLAPGHGAGRRIVFATVLLGIMAAAWVTREMARPGTGRIANQGLAPASMAAMSGAPDRPLYPSFAAPSDREVPAGYFLDSERCRDCHQEIYAQWSGSAHRLASLNNQWYLAAFADIQARGGPERAKWCAGCHDQALLFTGLATRPAAELLDRPEAHVGVACIGCHGIARVNSTLGQGDYGLEFSALHAIALGGGAALRDVQDAVLRLAPEIHRRTFLKPFHRAQPAQFCSACHKVHLDQPLNEYRWLRGFNEFDAWQQSGVSGNGVTAFYFPDAPRSCTDCHMPAILARLPDRAGPVVRSHRFAAANTALPLLTGNGEQAAAVSAFLTGGVASLDIFALHRDGADGPAAPLDRTPVTVRPGESLRIDVVVRNRGVGHAFPGGTADAADAWLEFSAADDNGVFFSSGKMHEDGRVDPFAHRYRSVLVDRNGQRIDRRNAWEARAQVYSRAIGPGSAEVVRYRLDVPPDVQGAITLTARLNYRKFQHSLTDFAFSDSVPRTPAARGRPVPQLPVTVMARASVTLPGAESPAPDHAAWERWNDYGIGLLLQGDLTMAARAFGTVTELAPDLPDGWANLGRVLLQQGAHASASRAFDTALSKGPRAPGRHFFPGPRAGRFGAPRPRRRHPFGTTRPVSQRPEDPARTGPHPAAAGTP